MRERKLFDWSESEIDCATCSGPVMLLALTQSPAEFRFNFPNGWQAHRVRKKKKEINCRLKSITQKNSLTGTLLKSPINKLKLEIAI
ncbi:hypothetical protein BpHYR1_011232 [Brachionus plicatilis]|uniref:Uncharacterized protein n=1 Tax=Brachionus plicatilis TaxID=10195 RepID=A0A3M7SNH0_BRAPC|nr:hypothetical protein BpHYR1_011232 [Brachionus plicatilis]